MADDPVTIARYQFLSEAEAARMHLEAAGIHAFLIDVETLNVNWLWGNAIGYIKLQVAESQADAALAVLEPIQEDHKLLDEDRAEDEGEDDAEPTGCPRVMDSLRSLKRPLFWLMLAPTLIGLALLVLMPLVWFVRLFIP
jgi:hypothetical protein